MTAVVAIAAATLQRFVTQTVFVSVDSFVSYWLVVAALNAFILGGDLAIRYWKTDSELQPFLESEARLQNASSAFREWAWQWY